MSEEPWLIKTLRANAKSLDALNSPPNGIIGSLTAAADEIERLQGGMSEETTHLDERFCKSLSDWMGKERRPPANQSFTAGPLRNLAYKIEEQDVFGGWQPRSTAPEDATSILCYSHGIREALVLYFDASIKSGWPWCSLDGICYPTNWVTHWMHLPKPPREEQ